MNILQFIPHSYASGATRHVVVLARELQKRGHRVTVLHPSSKQTGAWLPSQLKSFEIGELECPMRGAAGLKTLLTMAKWTRQHQINVIHTHATRAASFGFVIGALSRRPVIASAHTGTRSIVYRKLVPHGRNHVVAVSDYVRDGLLRSGAPPTRVRTVYNGTDFGTSDIEGKGESDFSDERETVRAEFQLPPEAQLVGVFAYLGELKGQEILVRAAREIVARCPATYFIFAGDAPPQAREALGALAQTEGVADRFVFAGWREDVPRLMDEMDIVAVPSRMESFSMVALEAMARGKAVVVARVGGIPEVILHEKTGLVVEREPDAFAAAIIALLQNSQQRAALGKAARERANTFFSAAVMTDALESLYRQVASA